MIEKLLTPDDVAGVLQVSRRTAYNIMHQMPHLSRPFRVTESGLKAWLNERTAAPEGMAEKAEKAPARHSASMRKTLIQDPFHIPRRKST